MEKLSCNQCQWKIGGKCHNEKSGYYTTPVSAMVGLSCFTPFPPERKEMLRRLLDLENVEGFEMLFDDIL